MNYLDDVQGKRRSKRIRQWQRELEVWRLADLSTDRQIEIIFELNHLYSRAVELAHVDASRRLFSDKPHPIFLSGFYLGDSAAQERLLERLRSGPRE